eukprot:537709-Hanusia_phi.AAC.4
MTPFPCLSRTGGRVELRVRCSEKKGNRVASFPLSSRAANQAWLTPGGWVVARTRSSRAARASSHGFDKTRDCLLRRGLVLELGVVEYKFCNSEHLPPTSPPQEIRDKYPRTCRRGSKGRGGGGRGEEEESEKQGNDTREKIQLSKHPTDMLQVMCKNTSSPSLPASIPSHISWDEVPGPRSEVADDVGWQFSSLCRQGEKLMVIEGIVYDVRDWVHKHPGGKVLLSYVGEDATGPFEAFHRDDNAMKVSREEGE